MELRNLIGKTHELHEEIKKLQTNEKTLKEQLEVLEKEIKTKLDDSGEDYGDLSEDEFQLLMSELAVPTKLTVEVVFVSTSEQIVCEVQLSQGATIEDAITFCGILDKCDEISLGENKCGIHGVIKPLSEKLIDGDRVEIYKPITAKI